MAEDAERVDPDVENHNAEIRRRVAAAKKMKKLPVVRIAEYRAAETVLERMFHELVNNRVTTHKYSSNIQEHSQAVYKPFEIGIFAVQEDWSGEQRTPEQPKPIVVEASEYDTDGNHKFVLTKGYYTSGPPEPYLSGRNSVQISRREIETPRQLDDLNPLLVTHLRSIYEFMAQLVNIASCP